MDNLKNELQKITRAEWIEEIVDDHLLCVLCGSALDFKHKTDFISGQVTEEAHCPACKIRNRQTCYSLQ